MKAPKVSCRLDYPILAAATISLELGPWQFGSCGGPEDPVLIFITFVI